MTDMSTDATTPATDRELVEIETKARASTVMHWPELVRLINRLRVAERERDENAAALRAAEQALAAEKAARTAEMAALRDDQHPMECEAGIITAAEDVLSWLLIEKLTCDDERSYTPHEAQKIIAAALDDIDTVATAALGGSNVQ